MMSVGGMVIGTWETVCMVYGDVEKWGRVGVSVNISEV